jgi:hypothetical protein
VALVGVGESGARDAPANAHVIELVGTTAQARFDITQALAASEATQRRNSRSGKWEISCKNTVRPGSCLMVHFPPVQIAASEKPP